ncbi:MAG: DUF2085 domain-containing protein [Clostridia bacterium]|nr:DUF2085 domain-containing protein [Clostridia bacterium]
MRLGNRAGCHQREDRSFSIKGWQFPVCSRCTGILTGQIIGIILYLARIRISIYIGLLFLLIMFLDWFIQYKKIRESTNLRRFITGNLAGIAQVSIIIELILNFIK